MAIDNVIVDAAMCFLCRWGTKRQRQKERELRKPRDTIQKVTTFCDLKILLVQCMKTRLKQRLHRPRSQATVRTITAKCVTHAK